MSKRESDRPQAGTVYRTANGKSYLCLYGIEYDVTVGACGPYGFTRKYSTEHVGHDLYLSIKWDERLRREAASRNVRDLAGLVYMLASLQPDKPWHMFLSKRTTPVRLKEPEARVFDPMSPMPRGSIDIIACDALFRYEFYPYGPDMPKRRQYATSWDNRQVLLVPAWKPIRCGACGQEIPRGAYWNGSAVFPRCAGCVRHPPKAAH